MSLIILMLDYEYPNIVKRKMTSCITVPNLTKETCELGNTIQKCQKQTIE